MHCPKEELFNTTPNALSESDLQECVALLAEGGAVNPESAANELKLAFRIAIKRNEGQIVGVGAIKRKRPAYAQKIAERSESPLDANSHELGYFAVKLTHRSKGISRQLADSLFKTNDCPQLFATTSSPAMKATLKAFGFLKRGNEWQGIRGDALSLWVRAE